ncbi:hypothetical protein LHJ74_23925 [Streptomyces sp. N2-109]|uniref:DUF8175 domain-containing protein n=1 Tax=Streptomyces gossypii TaxID=2883101 RepID=A0ABT2JZW1_9ACTN|nr:hypothetical protein [Streptomyces gossypii]MCT2592924.1 hypothetical protein [Streptomyces gossypii]
MSIGGDDYDERGRPGGSGPSTGRGSARQGTRTRLPGEDGDVYGVGRRSAARPGRSLLTVLSVVVLLIAAIAFANRGGDSGSEADGGSGGSQAKNPEGGEAQPTAPTGEKPVSGKDGTTGIPSGFPQTEQGAQSAATNYAVVLSSGEITKPDSRDDVVQQVFTPSKIAETQSKMDQVYSAETLDKIGLEEDGTAKDGLAYVSRTAPIGTTVVDFSSNSAKVDVWCTGVFGTAGEESTTPVTSDWFTMRFNLSWVESDWKVQGFTQKDGPAPVTGDNRASGADEIAKAVEQFGGFTYAR